MKTFLPLTLEQLKQFPKEFPLFLASFGIDKLQWENIKAEDSAKLAEVLEAFSALVWTDILGKAEYLEHRMKDGIACYFCGEEQMHLIYIRAETLNWTSASWYKALKEQWGQPTIDIRTGSKKYQSKRVEEMYALLRNGAEVSSGELYQELSKLLDVNSPS